MKWIVDIHASTHYRKNGVEIEAATKQEAQAIADTLAEEFSADPDIMLAIDCGSQADEVQEVRDE